MATKSSRQWLKEHFTDPYVKQAQKQGYRSRSVYKLLEIHERYRLFKPGMTVIDLGAAPGGWCQLVIKLIKPGGRMIALDILPMEPIPQVEFTQGDFSEASAMQGLQEQLGGKKADWVISDMAPNMSGMESVDVPRSIYLSELALDFALKSMKSDGGFLVKVFQGEGFDAFLTDIKRSFQSVVVCKPKASRGRSREVYVLARKLREKTSHT
jgi:23S rRNA (uridine2552-2'-O)-methyltransferase